MVGRALVLVALVSLGGAAPASAAFPGANGRIVFSSDNVAGVTGGYEVMTVEPGGGDEHVVGPGRTPRWSPDGAQIAFSGSADYQVRMMNADGSGAHDVLPGRDGEGMFPSWAPDGRHLAFHGYDGGIRHIIVVGSDGSGRTALPVPYGEDEAPAWSPDGGRIAFIRGHDADGHAAQSVMVMDADGSNQRSLTPDYGVYYGVSWSPDGRRLAFGGMDGSTFGVWSIGADGADRRLLTTIGPDTSGDVHPAWSPDGRQIVFEDDPVDDGRYSPQLFLMDADGANRAQLTFAARDHLTPDWQPLVAPSAPAPAPAPASTADPPFACLGVRPRQRGGVLRARIVLLAAGATVDAVVRRLGGGRARTLGAATRRDVSRGALRLAIALNRRGRRLLARRGRLALRLWVRVVAPGGAARSAMRRVSLVRG